ncbi:MAG TPA: hypothetical protein VGP16_03235 [Asanoa sp.]|nr:hypothetical protein [Asanoa sp.]
MTDFDFLVGNWDVVNRRLLERHTGSDKWDEFPGVTVAYSFFGGNGSFDEITFPTLGTAGATVRSYDPAKAEWSIWWISSRDGQLTPPVVGRWTDGVGLFYGDDVDGDQPVRCRFTWTREGEDRARWEQAFSTDGEQTWETNWVMEMTRRAA